VDGVLVDATYNAATGALTPNAPLSEGRKNISYTLSDTAGNESPKSDPLSVTIDTIAPGSPAAPTSYVDNMAAVESASSTAPSTNDITPGINIGALPVGVAGAAQDGELAAANGTSRGDRFGNLCRICHPRRDDERLAGAGRAPDQRQVNRFEGSDLVGGCVQALQQVDGRVIERAGEDRDAHLACMLKQRLMPLPRHVGFRIEIMQGASIPQASPTAEVRCLGVQRDRVRPIGLQLDSIGAVTAFKFTHNSCGHNNIADGGTSLY
jgi:hypothetical protein